MAIFKLTDQDVADLIQAMRDAQHELSCGKNSPEANRLYEAWESLIARLASGATADL